MLGIEEVKVNGGTSLLQKGKGLAAEVITGSGLTVNVTICGVPVHPVPVVDVGITLKITRPEEVVVFRIAVLPENVNEKSPDPDWPTTTPLNVPNMLVTVQL